MARCHGRDFIGRRRFGQRRASLGRLGHVGQNALDSLGQQHQLLAQREQAVDMLLALVSLGRADAPADALQPGTELGQIDQVPVGDLGPCRGQRPAKRLDLVLDRIAHAGSSCAAISPLDR
jgi:hypothetical protein